MQPVAKPDFSSSWFVLENSQWDHRSDQEQIFFLIPLHSYPKNNKSHLKLKVRGGQLFDLGPFNLWTLGTINFKKIVVTLMWSLIYKSISIKYISWSKENYLYLYLPFLPNSCTDYSFFTLRSANNVDKTFLRLPSERKKNQRAQSKE